MSSCSFWGLGVFREMLSTGGGGGHVGGVGGGLVSMGEKVAPRAFPPHSGSAGDVTSVSPVSYMTGIAFSRVSSPIWWLSCIIFLCVCMSLCLLSGFSVFCACELGTGRQDKVLEKGQGSQRYLCLSPTSLSLGVIWKYRSCRVLRLFLLLFLAVQSLPEWQEMI